METRERATEPSPEYVASIAEWTDVPAAMEAVAIRAQVAREKAENARAKRKAHAAYLRQWRASKRATKQQTAAE